MDIFSSCYRDARQARAILEHIPTDGCDAFGNNDTGQAATVWEHTAAEVGERIWQGDIGQPGTSVERIAANAGDRFLKVHTFLHRSMFLPTFEPSNNNKH